MLVKAGTISGPGTIDASGAMGDHGDCRWGGPTGAGGGGRVALHGELSGFDAAAQVKAWGGADGLIAGNPGQVVTQAIGVAASIAWAAIATFVILKVLGLIVPLRASVKEEGLGMDVTQHGEEAYGNGEGSILVLPAEEHHPAPSASPVIALAR